MKYWIAAIMLALCASAYGQKITLTATDEPAERVFKAIMAQTGMNFVYSPDVFRGEKLSITARNMPLKKALGKMFAHTDIEFSVKGSSVLLKRNPAKKPHTPRKSAGVVSAPRPKSPVHVIKPRVLDEVVVTSRLEAAATETSEIGAKKITAEDVARTPALLGEADVIKAMTTQPGISAGAEGMAGMYVHGGNADENLYMFDNVPLYQVNHFGGLFSAFNNDIIRFADFYKSSVPAKYDGRLSSFMDVRLKNGDSEGHHGRARLGLTSGAFSITGPIGEKTTYMAGIRRSWYDVLTVPAVAVANSISKDEKLRFGYAFMDLNAKVTHRFTPRLKVFASMYYGNDYLRTGTEDRESEWTTSFDELRYNFNWGNIVGQAGVNWRLKDNMTAEFTGAYTRYFSSTSHHEITHYRAEDKKWDSETHMKIDNNINDWIFRGDFDWKPTETTTVRYGLSYTRHSFLPSRTWRRSVYDGLALEASDSTKSYPAYEWGAYIEDDWRISDAVRINAGIHGTLFHIEGRMKHGISPRLSAAWRVSDRVTLKGAYSHTTQFVHQLNQSYMSLPTDQWIPVSGRFRPQYADKVSLAAYWDLNRDKGWAVSAEGYWKRMRHLVDYADEYYLHPPMEMWDARLTSGSGKARGVDVKVEKNLGRVTGHIGYSLAWADRRFAEKNGGRTFPARFDHRHSIDIVVNWDVSARVRLNALWTGHSGSRFTLLPQTWQTPSMPGTPGYVDPVALRENINNYRLPFYHRLDLSCTVTNSRGFWNFGLYNAYCHMNVIGVRRGQKDKYVSDGMGSAWVSDPIFQKISILPVIPSISYTWIF